MKKNTTKSTTGSLFLMLLCAQLNILVITFCDDDDNDHEGRQLKIIKATAMYFYSLTGNEFNVHTRNSSSSTYLSFISSK